MVSENAKHSLGNVVQQRFSDQGIEAIVSVCKLVNKVVMNKVVKAITYQQLLSFI